MAVYHNTVPQEFLIGQKLFLFSLLFALMFLILSLKKSTIRFLIITEEKMINWKSVWTMPQKATGLMAFLWCDQGGDKKAHSAKVKGPKEGHALIITSVLRGKKNGSHCHPVSTNVWSGNNKFCGNASNGVEWETHWKQPEFNAFYEQVYYYCLFMNDGKF